MPTYRVFHLSATGQVAGVTAFESANDQAAISRALIIDNKHGLELWGHGRLIRVFPPLNLAAANAARANLTSPTSAAPAAGR